MSRSTIATAEAQIASGDRIMRRMIARHGPCTIRPARGEHFPALVESIVYQQLAGKAAAAIHGRLVAQFDGGLTAERVLATPDEVLRGAGLSAAKVAAIRDLAQKVSDGTVPLHDVRKRSDDELVETLVQVRGIGRWTAEMFLMFQLGRLDVWPVDDYGVRKGYSLAYALPELPKPRELQVLGERFRPYRSVAAWYCWRAVETVTPSQSEGRSSKAAKKG